MKNKFLFTLTIICTAIVTLSVIEADAQTPRLQVSTRSVQTLLARIESRSRTFDRTARTNNTWNNSNERLSDLAEEFQLATATFRTRFNSRQAMGNELNDLLNKGLMIDSFVKRNRVTGYTATQWNRLRTDLITLARYYSISWDWNQAANSPPFNPAYRSTDAELRALIARIESGTNRFKGQVDSSLDRSRYNNTNREDSINTHVVNFEEATDRLKENFNSRRSTAENAGDVLNRARFIDQFVSANRLSNAAETQWRSLRTDLDTLASYYSVSWKWNQPFEPSTTGSGYTGTDAQLRTLINGIESKTNVFKRRLDNSLDRSVIDGTKAEDSMNAYVQAFEDATDRLKQGFNSRRATANDATEVLNRARYIDQFMARYRLSRPAENQWNDIRTDLNQLASYYRVSWNWNQPANPTTWTSPYTGTDAQVQSLIAEIESKTNVFKRRIDNSLDRSVVDGKRAEDSMNTYVQAFEDATNRLKRSFDSRRSTVNDATEVLNRARYIDQFMEKYRLSRPAENQWSALRTDLNTLATYYRVSWNWNEPANNTIGIDAALTGTYRLNRNRSDNVNSILDAAVRDYPVSRRDTVKRNLEPRLESPDMIAIDKRYQTVTLASSSSPKVTFDADGLGKSETNSNGRRITTTATATNDGLTINYEGDRINDFYVMFSPVGSRQMKVTRRVYLENKNETVTVSSIYDKFDTTALWATVNNGTVGDPGGVNEFYIPNSTQIMATLRGTVNTSESQIGDRFEMEVTAPGQYRGAILEGRIIEAKDSGRFLGRANLSLDFDTLRMNGRSYRFAGIIESVTAANGDNVTVNNEGTVRDSSQTKQTVTRAGIGALLGAIIGGIAGGGSGAAIGAGVGAGAGAGTVLITGRDDIELGPGSTFSITATAPANVGSTRN